MLKKQIIINLIFDDVIFLSYHFARKRSMSILTSDDPYLDREVDNPHH